MLPLKNKGLKKAGKGCPGRVGEVDGITNKIRLGKVRLGFGFGLFSLG